MVDKVSTSFVELTKKLHEFEKEYLLSHPFELTLEHDDWMRVGAELARDLETVHAIKAKCYDQFILNGVYVRCR